jgi:FAD synthase
MKIVEKNKEFILIIKIHSNEKEEEYKTKINNTSKRIIIEKKYENILKASIVITIDSTPSLEAAILDKDIIGKSNRYIRFEELEIGLEYKNFDKMEELIYQVKNDQKVKKNKKWTR